MAKYIDLTGLARFLDRLKTLVIAFKLKNDGAAEMDGCSATGTRSVAEGQNTTASANYSHAEGYHTTASGGASHAEGYFTTASGQSSHAEGYHTTALNQSEHAEGQWNISHSATTAYGSSGNTQHSVGIGANSSKKNNAFEIMQNGDAYLYGVGGYTGTTIGDSVQTLQNAIHNIESVTEHIVYDSVNECIRFVFE